jgi:hypothetical protein
MLILRSLAAGMCQAQRKTTGDASDKGAAIFAMVQDRSPSLTAVAAVDRLRFPKSEAEAEEQAVRARQKAGRLGLAAAVVASQAEPPLDRWR